MATLIVPDTGDYERQAGRLVADPAAGMLNAVYLRITTQRGRYWGDPRLGSRLHELKRMRDMARVAVLARQYTLEALKDLVDSQRINSLSVSVSRPEAGKLLVHGEARLATGEPFSFQHFVPVS